MLEARVSEVFSLLDGIKATRLERLNQVKKAQESLKKKEEELIISDKAVVVARSVYDTRVASFFNELESLVSMGLSKVFNRNYQFKIDYRSSGTKFLLASEETGGEFVGIISSHGGGIVQVISFILQVYAMQYSSADKVIMFDEPFAQVSSGYFKERLAQLIIELCDQFNYQFILVTHDNELLDFLMESPSVRNYRVNLKQGQTLLNSV